MAIKTVQARPFTLSKSPALLTLGLGAGSLILLGAADIAPETVWQAVFQFDGSTEHLIIRTVRLPRANLAVVVGSVNFPRKTKSVSS